MEESLSDPFTEVPPEIEAARRLESVNEDAYWEDMEKVDPILGKKITRDILLPNFDDLKSLETIMENWDKDHLEIKDNRKILSILQQTNGKTSEKKVYEERKFICIIITRLVDIYMMFIELKKQSYQLRRMFKDLVTELCDLELYAKRTQAALVEKMNEMNEIIERVANEEHNGLDEYEEFCRDKKVVKISLKLGIYGVINLIDILAGIRLCLNKTLELIRKREAKVKAVIYVENSKEMFAFKQEQLKTMANVEKHLLFDETFWRLKKLNDSIEYVKREFQKYVKDVNQDSKEKNPNKMDSERESGKDVMRKKAFKNCLDVISERKKQLKNCLPTDLKLDVPPLPKLDYSKESLLEGIKENESIKGVKPDLEKESIEGLKPNLKKGESIKGVKPKSNKGKKTCRFENHPNPAENQLNSGNVENAEKNKVTTYNNFTAFDCFEKEIALLNSLCRDESPQTLHNVTKKFYKILRSVALKKDQVVAEKNEKKKQSKKNNEKNKNVSNYRKWRNFVIHVRKVHDARAGDVNGLRSIRILRNIYDINKNLTMYVAGVAVAWDLKIYYIFQQANAWLAKLYAKKHQTTSTREIAISCSDDVSATFAKTVALILAEKSSSDPPNCSVALSCAVRPPSTPPPLGFTDFRALPPSRITYTGLEGCGWPNSNFQFIRTSCCCFKKVLKRTLKSLKSEESKTVIENEREDKNLKPILSAETIKNSESENKSAEPKNLSIKNIENSFEGPHNCL